MVNRTQHKRRSVKKTRAHRRKPHAHRRKTHARRRKTHARRRKTHARRRKIGGASFGERTHPPNFNPSEKLGDKPCKGPGMTSGLRNKGGCYTAFKDDLDELKDDGNVLEIDADLKRLKCNYYDCRTWSQMSTMEKKQWLNNWDT